MQELHQQIGQPFEVLGRGVVEAHQQDLCRIQELEVQMQRMREHMAMKEVIIASSTQQVQDVADQGLGVSMQELEQTRRHVRCLAKTGEEWDQYLLAQIRGVAGFQSEMQAHMQRLTARVETSARVWGGDQSTSPPSRPSLVVPSGSNS